MADSSSSLLGIDISNAIVSDQSGKKVYDHADLCSLLCNHCDYIVRDVHQLLGCGHRYCKNCVYIAIGSENKKCPKEDCNVLVKDGDVRLDRACHRDLLKLLAECKGCRQWKGNLLEIEDHYRDCMFITVPCYNGCGEKIIRKAFTDHDKVCVFRRVLCEFCKEEIRYIQMKEHISGCGFVPIRCVKCNAEVIQKELEEHTSKSCLENEVQCTFTDCLFEGKISEMRFHYKTHLHELFKVLRECNQQKNILMTRFNKAILTVDELHSKTQLCSKQMKEIMDNLLIVEDLAVKIQQLQDEISVTKTRIAQRTQVDSASGPGVIDDSEIRSLGNRIVKLEQEVLVIRPSIEDVQQTSGAFHDQIVGYIDVVQTIKEAISRHTVSMDEVRLRQDILDVKTMNGVFVWKIPEVSRRYREAKEKRTLSLYSPPFHTSPHGYRMCIRSYLNGDGSGKDMYISVFFVLMKSEHDDTLVWPFRRPVTFELVNQVSKVKSISESFMPDDVSPSFQQPKSEMNVASGFPKFAKQSVLKEPSSFVKDDAIFIRCKVDINGLQCE